MLPEKVGSKAVPSTIVVSCNTYEAIKRDQSRNRTCRVEGTIGKGVNLSKILLYFLAHPGIKCIQYTIHQIKDKKFLAELVERPCGTGFL